MFGFPKCERDTFTRNFLNLVSLKFQFKPMIDVELSKDEATKLFGSTFPSVEVKTQGELRIEVKDGQTPVVSDGNESKIIILKSEDGTKHLIISENTLTYNVLAGTYKNFHELKRELDNLGTFFDSCRIQQIEETQLRKVNIINFRAVNYPVDTLRQVLSAEILPNYDIFPETNNIRNNMHSLMYNKGTEDLHLVYGLIVPNESQPNEGQIVVDINRISKEEHSTSEIWNKTDSINTEVYNVFCWSISKDFKNNLRSNE